MRKIQISILVCLMALAFLATGVNAAGMESTSTQMIGATVRNLQGEVLGSITELERDSQSGAVTFAVLSHGDKLIPIPISALTFTGDNKATIDVTREMLSTAPSFEADKRPDMSDRAFSEAVHRYYGIRPYWEEEPSEQKRKNIWDPWQREQHMEY